MLLIFFWMHHISCANPAHVALLKRVQKEKVENSTIKACAQKGSNQDRFLLALVVELSFLWIETLLNEH